MAKVKYYAKENSSIIGSLGAALNKKVTEVFTPKDVEETFGAARAEPNHV